MNANKHKVDWDVAQRQAETVLRTMRIPESDLEDIVQNTMVALLEGPEYDPSRSQWSTWVSRIARFQGTDYYRRQARRPSHVPLDVLIDSDKAVGGFQEYCHPGQSRYPISKDMTERALTGRTSAEPVVGVDVADILPDKYATVFGLRARGLTVGQVSIVMNIPITTVKARITNTRLWFRQKS